MTIESLSIIISIVLSFITGAGFIVKYLIRLEGKLRGMQSDTRSVAETMQQSNKTVIKLLNQQDKKIAELDDNINILKESIQENTEKIRQLDETDELVVLKINKIQELYSALAIELNGPLMKDVQTKSKAFIQLKGFQFIEFVSEIYKVFLLKDGEFKKTQRFALNQMADYYMSFIKTWGELVSNNPQVVRLFYTEHEGLASNYLIFIIDELRKSEHTPLEKTKNIHEQSYAFLRNFIATFLRVYRTQQAQENPSPHVNTVLGIPILNVPFNNPVSMHN